jgi:hypothetical protein
VRRSPLSDSKPGPLLVYSSKVLQDLANLIDNEDMNTQSPHIQESLPHAEGCECRECKRERAAVARWESRNDRRTRERRAGQELTRASYARKGSNG